MRSVSTTNNLESGGQRLKGLTESVDHDLHHPLNARPRWIGRFGQAVPPLITEDLLEEAGIPTHVIVEGVCLIAVHFTTVGASSTDAAFRPMRTNFSF